MTQPHIDRGLFQTHLSELGVKKGGVVLVHSSLSSLGYFVGGADCVIGGLLEFIGSEGTLLMPAHTFSAVNRGERTFNSRKDASQAGKITEVFRQRPGVIRSTHPSHSVSVVGPMAKELIDGHLFADSPCGHGTPYAKLMDQNGQILLLGVGLKRNTCFHTVEAMAGVPYLLKPHKDEFSITENELSPIRVKVRCHNRAVPSRFEEFTEFLSHTGCLRQKRLGRGSSILIEAQRFRDTLLPLLADSPQLLLARSTTDVKLLATRLNDRV
ncbi:AAC(3) family N-acetyltransferase [Stieleria sp. ICT_E10.1]|uniref:AAC(3) family N-acetyltransferase n=1 Tax=Stieleria sedimenti TaxID=2976331 RepID=UPI00217F7538|nr:AAC(3) family N-acetyltransferase [Stieleria sedimenti]MCS7466769.1 AAC(3) family N-acetyltransferase [Stieleria sedimenti]